MKAVILAGGLGTRLRPLTCRTPKPLVPVLNKPLLEHTLELLRSHGYTDIICLLHYLPEKFREHFGNGSSLGVDIHYMEEVKDYGTAGAVKQVAPLLNESFFVLSGDALTNIDLTAFLEFHRQKGGVATIALSSVPNPSPFGVAMTDKDSRITRFLEKPTGGQIFSDTVNMGIYVLEPEVLSYIPPAKETYFARQIFPNLLAQNLPLFGYQSGCYWQDIGDLNTYQQIHWDALSEKSHFRFNGSLSSTRSNVIAKKSNIHQAARLTSCFVHENCTVGDGSKLTKVILWPGARIDNNCKITNAVIGAGTHVGSDTIIEEQVFISDTVEIENDCHVRSNVKIWPSKTIEAGSIVNSSMVWGERWRGDLFADSSVTGLANFEITPEFAAKLGAAFGGWLGKGHQVLLSRDTSHVARMIYRSLITGLMSAGIDIAALQVMPIPIVRYTLRTSRERGGIHVRRSAGDRKTIEILFFDGNGRDLTSGATKSIERIFYHEDFPRVDIDEVGQIDYPVRAVEAYVRHFLDHIDIKTINQAKYRIVVDYSFGAALQVFPTILSSLDCEVLALNAHPDSRKLHQTARDTQRAIKQLSKVVQSTQADAGFLFDKGAERIRAVDDKGRILSNQRLAILLTKLVLDIAPDIKMAVPVSAPTQIQQMAQETGAEILFTACDSSAVIKATEDSEVRFALTARGSFIFSSFHFAYDAMYTLTKILQFLAHSNQRLSALNEAIPVRFFANEAVACPWEVKGRLMRKATEATEGMNRILIDGVKVLYEDAWVLVSPVTDKALCQIMVEAGTRQRADELLQEYIEKVITWREK